MNDLEMETMRASEPEVSISIRPIPQFVLCISLPELRLSVRTDVHSMKTVQLH